MHSFETPKTIHLYIAVTLRKDSMDLDAKELLLNKVLGSAEEHQKQWMGSEHSALFGFILRCVLLNKISYILTILFQLQFEKHIQELFDESLTQEKLHQVRGHFLSVLRCRCLVD